jgi:hypothetical protein
MRPLLSPITLLSIILSFPHPAVSRADQEPAKKPAVKGIEGTWQGTLKAGIVDLRLAFKISKKPDGSFTATMDKAPRTFPSTK